MSEEEEEVFSSASVFRSYKTISADTHWRSKFLKIYIYIVQIPAYNHCIFEHCTIAPQACSQ